MTIAHAPCVILRDESVPVESAVGKEFVSDCARYIEGELSEKDIKSKWGLCDEAWRDLEHNRALFEAVRRERERRVAAGIATAEAAQRQFAKAPAVLGGILDNDEVSPRHRIEAARELRAIVTTDRASAAQAREPVTITINLGADEKYVYRMKPSLSNSPDGEQ
jgi:hypothetical protein